MNVLKKLLESFHLSKQLIDFIMAGGEHREIKSMDSLVSLGDIANKMFYVKKGGLVSQYFDEKSERERTTNFHLPSFLPFFVISESYFDDLPSLSQIKAFTKSEIIYYEKEKVLELVETNDEYRDFYYKNIVEVLICKEKLMSRLITLSPNRLYFTLLKEYPEIIKNVPSKYIAEFMGVTPQWLSKIKKTNHI